MLNQYKVYWHKRGQRVNKGTTIITGRTAESARYTFLHRFGGRTIDSIIKL